MVDVTFRSVGNVSHGQKPTAAQDAGLILVGRSASPVRGKVHLNRKR